MRRAWLPFLALAVVATPLVEAQVQPAQGRVDVYVSPSSVSLHDRMVTEVTMRVYGNITCTLGGQPSSPQLRAANPTLEDRGAVVYFLDPDHQTLPLHTVANGVFRIDETFRVRVGSRDPPPENVTRTIQWHADGNSTGASTCSVQGWRWTTVSTGDLLVQVRGNATWWATPHEAPSPSDGDVPIRVIGGPEMSGHATVPGEAYTAFAVWGFGFAALAWWARPRH